MDATKMPGAFIERGEIRTKAGDKYAVTSLDRPGIEAAEMAAEGEEGTYAIGDRVYFFLFRDGTGKILCRM